MQKRKQILSLVMVCLIAFMNFSYVDAKGSSDSYEMKIKVTDFGTKKMLSDSDYEFFQSLQDGQCFTPYVDIVSDQDAFTIPWSEIGMFKNGQKFLNFEGFPCEEYGVELSLIPIWITRDANGKLDVKTYHAGQYSEDNINDESSGAPGASNYNGNDGYSYKVDDSTTFKPLPVDNWYQSWQKSDPEYATANLYAIRISGFLPPIKDVPEDKRLDYKALLDACNIDYKGIKSNGYYNDDTFGTSMPGESGTYYVARTQLFMTQSMADSTALKFKAQDTSDTIRQVSRLFNPVSKEHIYTADAHEIDVLINQKHWGNDEGVKWTGVNENSPTRDFPVYRVYNPYTGEHLFTQDHNEVSVLTSSYGWNDEGTCWYSSTTKNIPVYRLYNPYSGEHLFTADANEASTLVSYGWNNEGVRWYGL